MKKYKDYKISEIPFAGEVPHHWNEIKLKNLTTNRSDSFVDGPFGSDLKTEHYTDFGIPIIQLNNLGDGEHINKNTKYTSEKKANSMKRSNIFPNDIVITKMMPVARAAIVNNDYDRYLISSDCIKFLVDDSKIDKRFLVYSINSNYFRSNAESYSTGATRLRTNLSLVKNFKVLFPPLKEQLNIAEFLDEKTLHIQTVIKHKKSVLENLQSYRRSLITETVTRGLNPHAKMKNSGVDWIEEIPEHWETNKLKNICEVFLSNVDKKSVQGEEEVSLCNYVDVYYNDEITDDMEFMTATAKSDQVKKFTLKKHDVLITKDSESPTDIAVPSWVSKDFKHVLCGYHLALLRPTQKINGKYLFFALMSDSIRSQFYSRANGVTRFGLGKEAIKNGIFPVPQIKEQVEIANFLTEKTKEVSDVIVLIKKQIEELGNYRQSLIYEAVTGKIDVRNYKESELEVKM